MKRLFFIFVILILLIILVTAAIFLSTKQRGGSKGNPIPAISPTQRPQQTPYPKPTNILTPTPTNTTNPPTEYFSEDEQKLIQKVKNRTPLSVSDGEAKAIILSSIGNKSGVVYKSQNFTIEYIKSPDVFQVTILNTNVSLAKQEAVSWFKSQGLSQEGICSLPVMFILDWNMANKLRGTNTQFSPLPDGC